MTVREERAGGALALTLAGVALLLWWLHDRSWWPPDEGVYAYVADRMRQGAALHRDLIDLHPGYPQYANSAALALFGRDLVSLRYPLVAMALLEAWIAFALLRRQGVVVAAVGALAAVAFSLPLFLNPSAGWYVLCALWLLVALLAGWPGEWHWRPLAAGALVGLAFFSRQSTGAFLGAGTLLWLLLELQREAPPGRRGALAPLLLGLLLIGLGAYLFGRTSGLALPLYGIWPLALLLLALVRLRPPDGLVLPLLLRLAAGFLLAALPLALASAAEGAFGPWLRDTFATPWRNLDHAFFDYPGFALILAAALRTLLAPPDLLAVASALLWLGLLALPPLVGGIALARFVRGDQAASLHPLLVLAPFHALVAVHFQIPDYICYGIAPLAVAVLWASRRPRVPAGLVALGLVVALATQAAQPHERSIEDIVAGRRLALDDPAGLPAASLVMRQGDRALYTALLERIAAATPAGGGILALPMNPELYFLSGRNPPVPWFASQLGLDGPADVAAAVSTIAADPPRLVIHRADDKWNTLESDALLAAILPRYRLQEQLGPFTLYRLQE